VKESQNALRKALSSWAPADVESFISRHYNDYWLRTDTKKQVEHARLLKRADDDSLKLVTDATTDAFTAITELTVFAVNHPRLLALFAGCCAAAGANIVGAHITTTRDGFALDTFLLAREFSDDEDEKRRARRIAQTIDRLLKGDGRLAELLAKRRTPGRRVDIFTVVPQAIVNNALSDEFTVIEVAGRDRPGLLYDLTSALSDLNLDIASAHITTFGEKAVDVFYVTDLTGKKVTAEPRQKAIKQRLETVLAGQPAAEAKA
jgi:[protein-PII] uridylyltransferase